MNRCVVLVTLLHAGLLHAQPVITSLDQPVQPTTTEIHYAILYSGGVQVALVTDGPDVEWNCLAAAFDSLDTIEYVDESTTACNVDLPGANMARIAPGEAIEHLLVTDDGIQCLGICTEAHGARIFGSPIRQMQYPCAYGMTWADSTGWTEPSTGRTGWMTRKDTVDGYGAVRLPWGITGGILGIRYWESWTTIQGADTLEQERWGRRLFKPGYRTPIMDVWMTPEFPPVDSLLTWRFSGLRYLGPDNFVGVNEIEPDNAILLVPQPADDRLDVIGFSSGETLVGHIVDGQGRLVRSIRTTTHELNIADLAAGSYNVVLTVPKAVSLSFVKR